MSVIGAVTAGLAGTIIITVVMAMAPKMGMPKMDMVGMLGTMFDPRGNRTLGWSIHLMMGAIFSLIYAAFWATGLGSPTLVWGLVFGAVHWLFAGAMMGVMPVVHTGIKSGAMEAPGLFMLSNGGLKSFMGGLMGHMIYGLVVVLVYRLFV